VKLMNARDWKGALAAYAEDAIEMPSNGAAVQGKAAIQAWLEAFPPFSNFQEESLEIDGQVDVAYDRGSYSMTLTPAGAAPIMDRGKYLTIWRKQADGTWKVVRDIFNSDLPLAAPAKPRAKVPAKAPAKAPAKKVAKKAKKK
jgi:ketosteroid isomerase-like protein